MVVHYFKIPQVPKGNKINSTHIYFHGLCVFNWESIEERSKCDLIFCIVSRFIKDLKYRISSFPALKQSLEIA